MENAPPIGPRTRGAYCLAAHLGRERRLAVGRLGEFVFPAGWYAYVGSAQGGIAARVERHLRAEKTLRWHLDYLLQAARVRWVICREGGRELECAMSRDAAATGGMVLVPGFGASDCRCSSHLYWFEQDPAPELALAWPGRLLSRARDWRRETR